MRFLPFFFFDINSQLLLKNVHQKRTIVSNRYKGFLKKKPAAVCAGEKDSVETWHVFAHFFKEPEAMTCPLSKGG